LSGKHEAADGHTPHEKTREAFAITVAFELAEGAFDEFHRLITRNAAMSVALEPDCLRFDVLVPVVNSGGLLLLYEIYTDRAAFDRHLVADHYLDFEVKSRHLVHKKTVASFSVAENAKPSGPT